MLFTGVILAPVAIATPALQDLIDLRTVVNAAANTIGDANNPNRGWGFNLGSNGQLGTADLVNNVTTTILRSKWQLDTNKVDQIRLMIESRLTAWQTMWLMPVNLTNETGLPALTPTLPLSSSLLQPSTLPTSTPTPNNTTTDLSNPYMDYVSAIPNLSTSLTSLGRAYHREMNTPVYQAIAGLQQSLSALQSTMLQSNLIRPNAVIRTLRASSSLEDAQQTWSRFLNLPGTATTSAGDLGSVDTDTGTDDSNAPASHMRSKRALGARPPLREGEHYTHQDLWAGKRLLSARQSRQGDEKWYIAFSEWEKQAGKSGLKARLGRLFVA